MGHQRKNQVEILEKLGGIKLNSMQQTAIRVIANTPEVVLLSPTGTGKTLAFLLPLINQFDPKCMQVQAIIIAPSRDLAIQIESVTRQMGAGFKTLAVYGGRLFSKDKRDLKHPPTVLVATPGRLADHLRRETFAIDRVHTLVLDEYDKSLEVGFEDEISEIISRLTAVKKRILTSATSQFEFPDFMQLTKPKILNFLPDASSPLAIKIIISPDKDKCDTLISTLRHMGHSPGIVFCNFKGSIARISKYLDDHGIVHGCFMAPWSNGIGNVH